MKVDIQDYCIRCGLCEDLYPVLFHLNIEDDKIDLKYEGDIPAELEDMAREARRDCAIAAIFLS
ncbi:MAG: ferredoxin [Actinobacteria bacterium]|nr:ferredoxin [Actinomycetota bacterium]